MMVGCEVGENRRAVLLRAKWGLELGGLQASKRGSEEPTEDS